MTPIHPTRVSIVGAGSVGATIAYAVMIRGLAREIVLSDLQAEKAEAEAKDLMHGSLFVPRVDVRSGSLQDCAGSAAVVIAAGAKQKPGQTRLDLAATNAAIFRELVPQILQAAPEAILVVVSNPVDVLTYIATRITAHPRARIIGSGTVLDTSRFRSLLATHFGVSVGNVHAYIVGEHGDSEVPLWSSASIAGVPIDQFRAPGIPPLSVSTRQGIFHNVRDAAAQVIRAKGATNWAIGLATARILEALMRDEGRVLTVSGLLEEYDGISDVCLSVPRVVSSKGMSEAIALGLSNEERAALQRSADTLRRSAQDLGF